jgi:hypothetical protein
MSIWRGFPSSVLRRFAIWQVLQRWLWLLQCLSASLCFLLVVDSKGGMYNSGACDRPIPLLELQCFKLLLSGIFCTAGLQLLQLLFTALRQNFKLVGIPPPLQTSLSMPKLLPTLHPYPLLPAFQ